MNYETFPWIWWVRSLYLVRPSSVSHRSHGSLNMSFVLVCWLWSFASAFSSFCSFFYSISTFLSDRSGSIRSRFELLQFEIEPFQFSKAWRMGTEPVPFGTTKFQIQTRSVLVMDEVLHAQLKMDGDEAERRSPSSITNIDEMKAQKELSNYTREKV